MSDSASRPVPAGLRSRVPRATFLVLCVLLGTALTGCTGGDERPAARRSVAPSAGSPSPTATPSPESVPLRVRITHLQGRLPARVRPVLQGKVRATIDGFVAGGFTGGRYPRSDFAGAFDGFTPGAARRARGDVRRLTAASYAGTARSVRMTRGTAYLSVLAPGGVAAGVAAQVDLRFVVDRGARPGRRVHLKGRLLLTRADDGSWKVFGYRMARSDAPVRSAS